MKQLLAAILTLSIFSGCTKIDSEKQASPVVNDTAIEDVKEDGFICMLPMEPEFPGGIGAWYQFLKQNLVYPATAVEQGIQGTVTVEFTVCTDGTLCDIEAISGPNELKESAVQVIKKSPRWIPTHINGHNIKEYKKQPIVFRLEEE